MEPADRIPSSVQEIPARGESFQAARERLNQSLSSAGEQAKHAARYANETVHANPWTSVGIGFGVGVLVGALVALAARSRHW
jgi:ElaB/YqjD/DUF883 family membrane-anchored ribosome-binding protein